MSVLACGRQSCPNIMCEQLIDNQYYICDSCMEELRAFKEGWSAHTMTEHEIKQRIMAFMQTPPGTHKVVDVDSFFESLIRRTI